ncbi:MAG: hypothetical protein J7L82_00715 [Staphylothermus sp.]|nr:hypothetical protein [Staphylothermus sp.]
MKLGGWAVMLTVMLIIMNLMGLPTGLSGDILDKVGLSMDGEDSSSDVEGSYLWITILAIFTTAVTAGIVIGAITKSYDVSLILAPIVGIIGGIWIGSFPAIINHVWGLKIWWMSAITIVIFGGLSVGFAFSCLDYFAGR